MSQIRNAYSLTTEGKTITYETVAWCIVVYGIILGFTISNFYNKYILIRETLVTEVTNLEIIFYILKFQPESLEVIYSIRSYVESVIDDLSCSLQNNKYSPKTAAKYDYMNDEIIKYFTNSKSNLSVGVINRMSTSEKIEVLVKEIDTGNFYVSVLWLLFFVILIPLYFSKMKNRSVQFLLELCLLIIFLTGIYMCTILNNPFIKSPISLDFASYKSFLAQIDDFLDSK